MELVGVARSGGSKEVLGVLFLYLSLSCFCMALILFTVGLILSCHKQHLSMWEGRRPWKSPPKRKRHTFSSGAGILNLMAGLWPFVGQHAPFLDQE